MILFLPLWNKTKNYYNSIKISSFYFKGKNEEKSKKEMHLNNRELSNRDNIR